MVTNITFILRERVKTNDQNKPLHIQLRYRISKNNIDFSRSIGFKVSRKQWDEKKSQIRNIASIPFRVEVNNLIRNLSKHFADYDTANKIKGYTPSYSEVKKHYESFFSTGTKEVMTFTQFVEKFVNESKRAVNPNTGKPVSLSTRKNYNSTFGKLKEFEKAKYKLSFDSVNMDFYNDFLSFCYSLDLATNTIGTHIKNIRVFMNNANERELTNNTSHRLKAFKIIEEITESIYLNESELLAIHDTEVSNSSLLQTSKDLFLIGAFTGLRVSDFKRLSSENLIRHNDQEFINVKTVKTGKKVVVPIHPIVKEILAKNEGNPPKAITEQNINKALKVLGEMAKIDSNERSEITKGGLTVSQKKHKYELITTHTARRSFCTNAYLSEMPTLDIMAISGHKTEKSFLKYIKANELERAEKIAQHSFFKNFATLKIAK